MGNSVANLTSVKFDLGFGNPVAVRNAFLDTYNKTPVVFTEEQLSKFDYPEREGDKEIIYLTRQVIRRQLGLDYKHILLTNGGTGGVVIALRAYKKMGKTECQTRNGPYYLRYPGMISSAGLAMSPNESLLTDPHVDYRNLVALLDVPSNPLGLSDNPLIHWIPTVLDGVYYNNVYTAGYIKPVPHDVLVGSYSKLLGLSGLRIGWIATNDDLVYERLKELVVSEYCGLSSSSSVLLKSLMKGFRWDKFESCARANLNFNREEWSKLERYFEGISVADVGMFYYSKMDSACKSLMEKSGIEWTLGSSIGTDDTHGRFNLGQDCDLVKKAVREVLKNDGLL
jgi:aspartate/methionine/tyrosine aminotransferase